MAWLYRHPGFLIAGSLPLALVSTGYILGCWLESSRTRAAVMFPALLAARLAYSAGSSPAGSAGCGTAEVAPAMRPRWE